MMAMITYDWAGLGEEAVRPRACNEPAVQFPIAKWSGAGAQGGHSSKLSAKCLKETYSQKSLLIAERLQLPAHRRSDPDVRLRRKHRRHQFPISRRSIRQQRRGRVG